MAYQVTLLPSGHVFEVENGRRILDAGLEAGFAMPYSCRAGACRTCRGRVLEGQVSYGANTVLPTYLTEEQKAEGLALLCSATACSDLVIELRELAFLGVKPKVVPCRVIKLRKHPPDVAVLDLKLPANDNFIFAAGQYIDLLLKDGGRRSYSIATAPTANGVTDIQLHVRHVAGGAFTDHVFNKMKEREILRFEGPLGTFFLREESGKPIVLVAGGTGFAPIKAIVEYAIARRIGRPMTLYWGCRTPADFYMLDLPMRWAEEHSGFTFVPVVSDPDTSGAWKGRSGLVHQAVMKDFPSLSNHQVYACGAPVMVDACRRDFAKSCGLPEDEFFADSFLTAADKGTQTT